MKTLKQVIAAYSEKTLNESINVYNSLALSGYTMQDLEVRNKAILNQQRNFQIEDEKVMKEQQRQAKKKQAAYNRIAPRCPEIDCNEVLILYTIRKPKGPANIYGYKSLYSCSSDTCFYERYGHQTSDELYSELLEKEKDNGS